MRLQTFQNLWKINVSEGRKTWAEDRKTWAAHIENRHAAQSGIHPLKYLGRRQNREDFMDVAMEWGDIIQKALDDASYVFTAGAVMEMAKALQGRVGLNQYCLL